MQLGKKINSTNEDIHYRQTQPQWYNLIFVRDITVVLHNYTYINAQHAHLQLKIMNSILNKKHRSLQVNFWLFVWLVFLKEKMFLKAEVILAQLFLNPETNGEMKTQR